MKSLQAHMSEVSHVDKVRYITELEVLRQEHPSFHKIFKRKLTRQSWNKKPGKPRETIIADEELILRKPFYLKANSYSFHLY